MNEELRQYREKVAKIYDSQCTVCGKKFGKYFAFHHLSYRDDEKTYRDFKNQDDYQRYILPIIQKRPKDFVLLCRPHHRFIEIYKNMSPWNFDILVRLMVKSRPPQGTVRFEEQLEP